MALRSIGVRVTGQPQTQRSPGKGSFALKPMPFEGLVTLYGQLEKLENQKTEALATQDAEAKNFIPNQKVLNQCLTQLTHVEKNIREVQKKIDGLFQKLTDIKPVAEIYPFPKLVL